MFRLSLASALVIAAAIAVLADDTVSKNRNARPLFNGTDFTGWQTATGKAITQGWVVHDGAMVRESAGGDIWTKDRFGNFVLELEFKTEGNSGVFIRTDKPTDNVQTGIEIQIDKPTTKPSKHSVGALYDLVAPTKDNTKKDDWNTLTITAEGSRITVVINGEKVNAMDLDQWTEAGKNPDGSKNKFKMALKDFKREGHIGLQDHGAKVSYRNIRLTPLP
ncbi:MAG: DUF1080 domain-containing protein [Gemmataceae bacterium]|nr:DUF1080 domain-containing protein [Gemmata sp.]MDW8197150.1 DUF1080 domain-containing protein [Gemmataceae bacterium]